MWTQCCSEIALRLLHHCGLPGEDVGKNEPDQDVKPWREISNSSGGKIYGTWKNLCCLEMFLHRKLSLSTDLR